MSMGEFYVAMVRDHGDLWARFLRVFTRADRLPVLFHCTAGRDRTGVATVLLLEALGVPRETILSDYLLSNEIFPESTQEAHVLDPLFRAIDASGGIESYLASLGLDAVELDTVRTNLLVDPAAA
jgi:protein-tyrosine phosphatase